MRTTRSDINSRPGRRVRTRLTRLLAFAVAGPVMAGSLAYAAGVEPVRRRVDDFLKGTAGFFKKAESTQKEFHLYPNPSGHGVLVMPLDDRGPRAAARNPSKFKGNSKESSSGSRKKSEADEREPKKVAAGSSVRYSEDSKANGDVKEESGGSGSHSGSDGEELSVKDGGSAYHDGSHDGSGESDDDRSGSDSGSGGGEHDHSGSGASGSSSEKD
jgi:hypothetical protein